MIRKLLLWASDNPWMVQRLPRRRFVRKAVRRFLPGEGREAALAAAEGLAERRLGAVFTLLGENVETPEEVEAVAQEYLALLKDISTRGLDAEISIKLTQFGLDLDRDRAVLAVGRLAKAAKEAGSYLWIDMEGTAYLRATLACFRELLETGSEVGICIQAYLRSSPQDMEDLLHLKPSIRIVKGAYSEPESLAFAKRAEVDEAYFDLVTRGLQGGARMAVATHDGALIERIRRWVREKEIPTDRYEFQMLFGIQPRAQDRLAQGGEPTRVLISYGPSWFPWYMRRLAERPANLWFVVKNFFLR